MRIFKIYSLINLQIYWYNTVLLTIDTRLYITSPWLIYNWKFVPFEHIHPFPPHVNFYVFVEILYLSITTLLIIGL